MKAPSAAPRDCARDFGADEMFFSTTDARGIITAGNDVFTRISGYPADALVGSPHNIIRHPEMPRAAFRLVWSYLKQSRRAAAFVKNLARDGCYYWVVALFTPIPGGYLSIRFKPSGRLFEEIAPLYRDMLREEERQLANGADQNAAMDASTAILETAVRTRGFADYDAFMRDLLCDELKNRDATLARAGATIIRPSASATQAPETEKLLSLYASHEDSYARLSSLFVRLDEFVSLQKALEGKTSFVDRLTQELRLAAMNASLASSRAGAGALSLGVVSHHMGKASAEVSGAVGALTREIREVSQRLRSVVFNLAAGRLQIEMTMIFLWERIATRQPLRADTPAARAIAALQHTFHHSMDRARAALGTLEKSTRELSPTAHGLARLMLELQVAQLSGLVEATRLTDQDNFTAVFSRIRELIRGTHDELSDLENIITRLDKLAADTPATATTLAHDAAAMMSASATQP